MFMTNLLFSFMQFWNIVGNLIFRQVEMCVIFHWLVIFPPINIEKMKWQEGHQHPDHRLDEWEGQKLEGGGIRNRKQSDRKIRRLIREVKDINIDALKINILIPGWCTRRHLLCCDQERNTVTNLRNHPSCFCWKKRGFKRFVGRHYQGPAETEDTSIKIGDRVFEEASSDSAFVDEPSSSSSTKI